MLIACDNIDKLLCVEMRRPGLPRGFKWPLYEIARGRLSEPMVLAAARLLDRPPAAIGIVTGAAVPKHMPKGENDGPFGAVALARALNAIGHRSTVYTDAECAPRHRRPAGPLRFRYTGRHPSPARTTPSRKESPRRPIY